MFDRPAIPRGRGQMPITDEPKNADRSAIINDDNEEETMVMVLVVHYEVVADY